MFARSKTVHTRTIQINSAAHSNRCPFQSYRKYVFVS
uniref:Uncharacterized protein n=1 Tax=Rhizophora mucronata TaxID=61149 RepID=A0A2P2P6B4_RHIMU